METGTRIARSQEVGAKLIAVFNKRMQVANDKFAQRVSQALSDVGHDSPAGMTAPVDPLGWYNYAVDAAQRSILFWDTLRQRGNNFIENTATGSSPFCTSTPRPSSTAAASTSRSTTRCCASRRPPCRRRAPKE